MYDFGAYVPVNKHTIQLEGFKQTPLQVLQHYTTHVRFHMVQFFIDLR